MDSVFFALSAGRSGSQTLSHTLTQAPNCLCLHEPFPQFVKESAKYAYKDLSRHNELVATLISTRQNVALRPIYGETNNRLSLMVPVLKDAFPLAKYVWLIRDGRDFVASETQRGAFNKPRKPFWATSRWDRWRLRGDKIGAVSKREWRSWSAFEKVCWQWSWVNTEIAVQLNQVDVERVRQVRTQDLASETSSLAAWLGLEDIDFVVPQANRRRPNSDRSGTDWRQPNNVDSIRTWANWTPEEHAIFRTHCSPLMDEIFPGWDSAMALKESPRLPAIDERHDRAQPPSEIAATLVESVELRSQISSLREDPAQLALLLAGAVRRQLWTR